MFAGTIKHSGSINADSIAVDEQGHVQLFAKSDIDITSAATISANAADGGAIKIESETGTVWNSGSMEALGSDGAGGTVHVLGERVAMLEEASINASGENGGGQILIGGDYQGRNGSVKNAQQTHVGENSLLRADAITNGDGGKVIVWADDTTRSYGNISVRGGNESGNGGFVETSGKKFLDVTKAPDISASNGDGGTWLLDPEDVDISVAADSNITGATPFQPAGAGSSVLNTTTLQTALNAGGTVIVDTTGGGAGTGNLTVSNAVSKTSGADATLDLRAHNNLDINADITSSSNQLNMIFDADQDSVSGGVINLANVTLDANGGTIDAGGETVNITAGATINSAMTVDTVNFQSGSNALNIGDTLTVTSALNWSGFVGPATINGGGTGILNLPLGSNFNITAFEGSAISPAVLDNLVVNNAGTINYNPLESDDPLSLTSGTILNNSGTFDIQTASANITGDGSGTINNTNIFQKSSSGTSAVSSVSYINTGGTVDIQTGTLSLGGNTLTLDSGSTLMGSGTFSGNVNNSGTISPGNSIGTLTIDGNLTLNSSSVIEIEISDTGVAGTNYDLIDIINGGNGSFDGTIDLVRLTPWVPAVSDSFDPINCDGVCSGSFSTIDNPFGVTSVNQSIVSGTPDMLRLTVASIGTLIVWDGGGDGVNWTDDNNWNLNIAPNSTHSVLIDVGGGLTVTLNSGGIEQILELSNSETLSITGGTLQIDNDSRIEGTIEIFTGATIDNAQNLTVGGTFNYSGGTVQGSGGALTTNGSTNLGTINAKTLTGIGWDNFGTATLTGGNITLTDAAAILTNKTGALFNVTNPSSASNITGSGSISNEGTWRQTTSQSINVGVTMANSGLLDVDEDNLFIDNLTNTGTIDIASTKFLTVDSGSHTLALGTVLSGDGAYQVNNGTLDVTGAVTVPGTLSLTINAGNIDNAQNLTIDGVFNFSGGTVQGSGGALTTNGSTNLATINTKTLTGIGWDNFGTATLTGGNITLTDAAAILTNKTGVLFNVTNPSSASNITGAGSISNEGTWRQTTSQSINVGVTMANSGLLDVDNNALSIDNLTNTGTIDIASGFTLQLNNSFTQTAGTTTLNNGGNINSTPTLNFNGGTLTGTGTITGNVNNSGTISPGNSIGTLTINGDLTLNSSSVLEIEISNTGTAGTNYDLINVLGSGNFDGSIDLVRLTPWVPAVSDSFDVIDCLTGCGGTFTTINNPFGVTSINQSIISGTPDMLRLTIASIGSLIVWDGGGDGVN